MGARLPQRWHRAAAGIALAAVVVLAAVLVARLGSVDHVRATVAAAGMWAPVLFLLVHAVVTVVPFPRTVFTVAAGVLFGSVLGVVLAMTATVASAALAYCLVRGAGGDAVTRRAPASAVEWVRVRLERSGLLAMVSLRLIPALPFSVLNYASALSGVRMVPYLLGTLFGVLPGTVAIVVLGDAAVGGDPPPAMLAVSVACALLGIVGAVTAARRPAAAAPAEPEIVVR